MPKNRKYYGRSKGAKGTNTMVSCAGCGKLTPRDKAKKQTKIHSFVDPHLARELRKTGTAIARSTTVNYYCISCAVHRGIAGIRADNERKIVRGPRRF